MGGEGGAFDGHRAEHLVLHQLCGGEGGAFDGHRAEHLVLHQLYGWRGRGL